MIDLLRNPNLLPASILGGVGALFLVLVSALPTAFASAVIGGTSLAAGLVIARLRRETLGQERTPRVQVEDWAGAAPAQTAVSGTPA